LKMMARAHLTKGLFATVVFVLLAAGSRSQTEYASVGIRNDPVLRVREQGLITIAPAVKIDWANSSKPDYELQIATDPSDANRLIVCSILLDDVQNYETPWPVHVFVYTSLDGGLNWQATYARDDKKFSADPSCTFGPDGSAYFSSFGSDIYALLSARAHSNDPASEDKARLRKSDSPTSWWPMFRSSDGGRTWRETGGVSGVDREYITVDDTTGKYRGRVYVHGMANTSAGVGIQGIDGALITGLAVFHSVDAGDTYSSVKLADEGTQYVVENANGIVTSDGTFATIFADASDRQAAGSLYQIHPMAPNAKLKFIFSEDGGRTFGKAVLITDDWYLRSNGGLMGQPSLAVDRTGGLFHDRIYAAWVDARSGRGEIRFAYSADKGRAWSSPHVVSDNWPRDERGETPDAFMPTLAVNRNGVLGVMWYDRRDHADNLGYDIRFSVSLDGGDSFLPSVLVSRGGGSALQMRRTLLQGPWYPSVQHDGRIHAAFDWSYGGDNGGDTAGLACDSRGIFHALWIDRRFGLPQASTTRITVNSAAMSNGGGGLESLRDLSSKAQVRYSLASIDLSTDVITVGAVIANTSAEPIPGRLTLRLLALSSAQGLVEAQNADNGFVAAGALWQFHAASGDSLEPGAQTVPRQLRFKLAHASFPPPIVGDAVESSVLELNMRILGK
jgi:hypothetical protein